MNKDPRYLSAPEAARELNITVATLYAYVSRGLIRSESGPGKNRARRYHAEDVTRLKQRKQHRRNPAQVAEQALQAGAPVLESAITLIADDSLYYRGHNVLALAANATIEAVAQLIWTGQLPDRDQNVEPFTLSPRCQAVLPQLTDLKPIERMQAILPIAAVDDLAAYDRSPPAVARTGSRLLNLLTQVTTGSTSTNDGLAQTLQQQWTPTQPQATALFNAALILCADHELNASAFTARCAASTGANPYGVVIAGMAALQGYRHGTASEQVEIFFREVEAAPNIRQALVDRLKRGESIPGYGHIIYRTSDPRAKALHHLLQEIYPHHPALKFANDLMATLEQLIDLPCNIDFMLATLARLLVLPPGGGPALFALGRTVGWLGHAIEQYQISHVIRPRARYIGVIPNTH